MSNQTIDRGEVVLVKVPYLDASASARRPALVVCDPSLMRDVVIAAISSRIRSPLPALHYLVNQNHPDWSTSGLRLASVIRCDRLFTIERGDIHKRIGSLAPSTMQHIGDLLKAGLGIT